MISIQSGLVRARSLFFNQLNSIVNMQSIHKLNNGKINSDQASELMFTCMCLCLSLPLTTVCAFIVLSEYTVQQNYMWAFGHSIIMCIGIRRCLCKISIPVEVKYTSCRLMVNKRLINFVCCLQNAVKL